jgi:hypothetical protein
VPRREAAFYLIAFANAKSPDKTRLAYPPSPLTRDSVDSVGGETTSGFSSSCAAELQARMDRENPAPHPLLVMINHSMMVGLSSLRMRYLSRVV